MRLTRGSGLIVQPNGLLARFSTIVDDFTHINMGAVEAYDMYLEHYGRSWSREAVENATSEKWDWAISVIEVIHGKEQAELAIKVCSEPIVKEMDFRRRVVSVSYNAEYGNRTITFTRDNSLPNIFGHTLLTCSYTPTDTSFKRVMRLVNGKHLWGAGISATISYAPLLPTGKTIVTSRIKFKKRLAKAIQEVFGE